MRKAAVIIAVVLVATFARAQSGTYANQVIFSGGFPYPTVRVCTEPAVGTPCTPLANIFSDQGLTQVLPNPFTGDATGKYVFYAALTSTYHVQVSGSGLIGYDIANITLPGATSSGGGTTVNGTPNQITVTTAGTPSVSTVGFANPTIFPGPITTSTANVSTVISVGTGTFGGALSSIALTPDPFSQFAAGTGDQVSDRSGNLLFNSGGVGSPGQRAMMVRDSAISPTVGQVYSYISDSAGTEFRLGAPISVGNINAVNGVFTNLTGTFSVSSSASSLVLGITNSNPCCSLAAGSLWQLTNSYNGFDHLVYFDTSGGYQIPIIANDTPCNMLNGCSGTGATALVNSPTFINPFIGNATGTSLTLNLTTGDQMDLQPGTVTQFVQATPQSGHIKTGYGSDGTFKLSNGSATDNAFYSVTQTVAGGTQALPTGSITTATCNGGTAATATGALSTDTVDWSFNAAPTTANKYGSFLVVYAVPSANTVTFYVCNPSATTSTPTSMSVNWKVKR